MNINDKLIMAILTYLLTGYRITFVLGSEIAISHFTSNMLLMDGLTFKYDLLLLIYEIGFLMLVFAPDSCFFCTQPISELHPLCPTTLTQTTRLLNHITGCRPRGTRED